ncbi:MAG: ATP-binding protein [Alphaproteobacteria bacterium]|nr:ATP-binding protein [Alphaproteobacteria bacterium]
MIERMEYLNKLITFKDKQLIKVVTGVRRCGKSTLFLLFQEYLKNNGVSAKQIQSINFEDMAFSDLLEPKKLYDFVMKHAQKGKKNYIFLDEIQNVADFQKAIDSLYIQEGFDIYVTGSNAFLLSGELATLLSGRYVEIKMLPLSFKEFISKTENPNLQAEYARYLEYGSFPFVLQINDDASIKNYLSDILNSIVIKDVLVRHKISDTSEVLRILKFIFDTVGNVISVKKISDTMTSAGYKISPQTVEKYLNALTESFILYPASRYDIKGKKYLQSGDKYYLVDTGIRYALLGKKGSDTGHLLENIVYLELIRRGYTVFVGKLADTEVDFVAVNQEETVYYQISQTILDETVLKRELKPLQNIKDNHPKYLLTLDYLPNENYDGIKRLNVLNWLISK